MSTDRYDPLITRVLACLHLMKQDAVADKGYCHPLQAARSSALEWVEYNYRSYLALKNVSWENMAEPPLAFPPATRRQIRETERKLGFPLPPLLRLLYERVGNGGFGPCYGIVGGVGGFPFQNQRGRHVAAVSLEYRRWYSSIRLEDCQQMTIGTWEQARQEQDLPIGKRYRKYEQDSDRLVFLIPSGAWPTSLLALLHHGCGICSWIDAHSSSVYDWFSPDGECDLLIWDNTLEAWLDDWLTQVEKAYASIRR